MRKGNKLCFHGVYTSFDFMVKHLNGWEKNNYAIQFSTPELQIFCTASIFCFHLGILPVGLVFFCSFFLTSWHDSPHTFQHHFSGYLILHSASLAHALLSYLTLDPSKSLRLVRALNEEKNHGMYDGGKWYGAGEHDVSLTRIAE